MNDENNNEFMLKEKRCCMLQGTSSSRHFISLSLYAFYSLFQCLLVKVMTFFSMIHNDSNCLYLPIFLNN